jgi:hypothetical protein
MESFSEKELQQLKELTVQSLEHYSKILADKDILEKLKDGDKLALRLCFEETQNDLKEIDEFLKKFSSVSLED